MWEVEAVTEYEILSQSLREWTDEGHEARQVSLCPIEIRVLLCAVMLIEIELK
jgi:hypothetical protein